MSDYNDGLVPEPCLRLSYGFGQQYASVELGDGTGYVRVTDDLRSEHHKMKRWYDDELRVELDENAKLRELVRDMYKAFVHGNCYRWCEFKEPCNFIEDGRCQWYDRMCELGAEVE